MNIFDSHCHLDDPGYDADMDRVIQRMHAAEVRRAMIVGIDETTSKKAVALAQGEDDFGDTGCQSNDALGGCRDGDPPPQRICDGAGVCRWRGGPMSDGCRQDSGESDEPAYCQQGIAHVTHPIKNPGRKQRRPGISRFILKIWAALAQSPTWSGRSSDFPYPFGGLPNPHGESVAHGWPKGFFGIRKGLQRWARFRLSRNSLSSSQRAPDHY